MAVKAVRCANSSSIRCHSVSEIMVMSGAVSVLYSYLIAIEWKSNVSPEVRLFGLQGGETKCVASIPWRVNMEL